jgi:predicted dehydrogenase
MLHIAVCLEVKTMKTKLSIAVIGVGANPGSRARQYLATIARLTDHYELTAICDRDSDALREVATQYGAASEPRTYERIRTLFDAEKPDVVLSLTPKDSHIVIALTAARHGAHIITEIPVALTRRYAEAISQACRRAGVLWEIAEQVWLWPQERLKKRIIESGRIGRLTHARLWYLTGQYHGFSAVRALLGAEARRVLGYCGEVETEPYKAYGGESESSVKWENAIIEFDNDVVCLFEKPPRVFPSSNQGFPTGWQIEGTQGYIERNRLTLYRENRSYEVTERYVEMSGERALDTIRVDTDPPVIWENPFKAYRIGSPDDVAKAAILVSFHEAITQGGIPQYGVENALRDWEICLAIRESARLGNRWVTLPLDEPTELECQIEAEFVRRYGHDPVEETGALLETPFSRSATLWPFAHWL